MPNACLFLPLLVTGNDYTKTFVSTTTRIPGL